MIKCNESLSLTWIKIQNLNSIIAASASAPQVQCSPTAQLTAFADTTTAFAPADHRNNYPVLDTALLLQQGQRPNALIYQVYYQFN